MEKFDNRVVNSVGSSRIRVRWLLKYWPEAEEFIIGKEYDCLIFQKVYWKPMMQNFKGIKILDICDPDWLEGKPVMEFIDLAHAVTCSTQALVDYIKKLRPAAKAFYVPDRMDLAEFPVQKQHTGDAKTIAWFGYNHNIHYLYKTFQDIIDRNLELTIISDQPFNPGIAYQALKVKNIPYSYPAVHEELLRHDMILMPDSVDDLRGQFKSNNKTLEAWALGLPVVRVPEDLDRFKTAEARQKEADMKFAEIKKDWLVQKSVSEMQAIISEVGTNG